MNPKISLCFALFTIIFAGMAFATPPSVIPCYEVENPEHYKDLVSNSEVYSYFQGWELKNIAMPCRYKSERAPITDNVVLKYNIPKSYSTNNLDYQTTVIFSFEGDRLINSEELSLAFKNYKRHIADFESEENIKFFIQTTGATNVSHESGIFELKSRPREYVNYDFAHKSIASLSFTNPILIKSIERFIPKISGIPQINEFRSNAGIRFIEFSGTILSVYEDFSCPNCESYLLYDLDLMTPSSYSLDNNFEWKAFPEISRAHKAIEENLLVGELSNCMIGTGDAHSYTISRYHNSPTAPWIMTAALKCDEGTRLKDAHIRLNADGTYDELEIEMDYHPKAQPKPIISNSVKSMLAIMLIILAVIALIIKLKKR